MGCRPDGDRGPASSRLGVICGVDASESAKCVARVARALSARLALRLAFGRVVEDGTDKGKIAASAARLHQMAGEAPEVDGGARWRGDVGRVSR